MTDVTNPDAPPNVVGALLPCPFCGGPACVLNFNPDLPHESYGLVVYHTESCFFTPAPSDADGYYKLKSNAEIADCWNTRITQPPSADHTAREVGMVEDFCAAMMVSMLDHGVGADILECITLGDQRHTPPGALAKAVTAAMRAFPDPRDGVIAGLVEALKPFADIGPQKGAWGVISKKLDGLTSLTVTVTKDQMLALFAALAKAGVA